MNNGETLTAGINETTLVVNYRILGNRYANTFGIFLKNVSEADTLVFLNEKKEIPQKCMWLENVLEDLEIGKITIRVPVPDPDAKERIFRSEADKPAYFAAGAECEEYEFQLDKKWTVKKNGYRKEQDMCWYEWILIPSESYILEPGAQVMIQMCQVESYLDTGESLAEDVTTKIAINAQYAQYDSAGRSVQPVLNAVMEHGFNIQKAMQCSILDFFSDEDAVEENGKITMQWNITGAAKGTLRNVQEGTVDNLEDMDGNTVISKNIAQTTDFTLEISSQTNETIRRNLHIRVSPPVLKRWRLNRNDKKEGYVEWEVKCVDEKNLFIKGIEKKNQDMQEGLRSNRGLWYLNQIGDQQDRLTLFTKNTTRDIESTLWIPNRKDYAQVRQFRKTHTYFYGFYLLEVAWELEPGSSMALVCHDLERNQFWKIAENKSQGIWEQAIPCIPQNPQDYMEIRLQGDGFEIIF